MFVCKGEAIDLLRMESAVNDTMSFMCLACEAISKTEAVSPLDRAKYVNLFSSSSMKSMDIMSRLRKTLAPLPLAQSWTMCNQWLKHVREFAGVMSEACLREVATTLQKSSSAVDTRCPRWGTFISDDKIDLEVARMQFGQKSIQEIPGKVRELAQCIKDAREVGKALGVEKVGDHPICKDSMRVAAESFNFGKATTNIAGAVRVATAPPNSPAANSIHMVMELRSSLPAALVARLDAMKAEQDQEASETPAGAAACGSGRSKGAKRAGSATAPAPKSRKS